MVLRLSDLNWLALGVSVGLLLAYPIWGEVLKPEPYGSVKILTVEPRGEQVFFEANFEKKDCSFQALDVVGLYLGRWVPLNWSDTTGGDQGDRTAGGNTLSLLIQTEGLQYDTIEIRTRHICGGTKVDKTFSSFRVD